MNKLSREDAIKQCGKEVIKKLDEQIEQRKLTVRENAREEFREEYKVIAEGECFTDGKNKKIKAMKHTRNVRDEIDHYIISDET